MLRWFSLILRRSERRRRSQERSLRRARQVAWELGLRITHPARRRSAIGYLCSHNTVDEFKLDMSMCEEMLAKERPRMDNATTRH